MKRLEYLDALRGIAAMMVVIYHFINWHWVDLTKMKVASVFFNGADAVSFFFVLSGFVLSYKYFQGSSELNIPKYVYKRILRLYPAFVVTVLMNYLYWNRENLNGSLVADMFYHNKQGLWQELWMIKEVHKFYIPGWTLGVELAVSMLVPFFIILARKNVKLLIYLLPISFFLGQHYLSLFTFHFLFGMLLAYYYPQIQSFKFSESRFYRFRHVLPFIVLALFSARHFYKIQPFGSAYESFSNFFGLNYFHYSAMATTLMIFAIINSPRTQKLLQHRSLLFIGKISYSIYLSHWIIVVYVMRKWKEGWSNYLADERLTFILLLLATIVATLVLSTLMYYLVENPSMNFSYRSSERLFPKRTKRG